MAAPKRSIDKRLPGILIRRGYLIVFACIFLIVTTLAFIRFKETVKGEVVITGAIPPYEVITERAGRLVLLRGEEGDVQPGEPLAYLESETVYDDLLILKEVFENEPLSRLADERLRTLQLGSAIRTALEGLRLALEEQQAYERLDRTDLVVSRRREEIGLFEQKIDLLRNQAVLLDSQALLKASRLALNDSLLRKGGISGVELEATNLEFLAGQTDKLAKESEIKDFEVGIKDQQVEILEQQNQRDLYHSALALKVRNAHRLLKDAIDNWEQTNLLRSPFAGTSILSDWMQNGEYLPAGTKIMTILPIEKDQPAPKGYMKLPIANAGKIMQGLQVNVRLHNYPYKEFGVLHGTVRSVSRVANQQLYNVELDFAKGMETSYRRVLSFQQMLEGEGEIITGRFNLFTRIWQEIRSERLNE